jgi:signal peptidase II
MKTSASINAERNAQKDSQVNCRIMLWLSSSITALIADQASKYIVRQTLLPDQVVSVLPGILHWHLLFNTGAAFSSLSGHTFLLTAVSAAVSVGLVFYTLQIIGKANKLKIAALAFLLAGATGNLIDRFAFSKVTDFIDLAILPGDFAIFNLADLWINVAVFLFAIDWLRLRKKSHTSFKTIK